MFTGRIVLQRFVLSVVWFFSLSCMLPGQQNPAVSVSTTAQEFPVVMQQSVAAGKTAVGTKVRAKLEIATLVDGTVLPRNAMLTGEVTESAAKTAHDPSRLGIRMDSAEWKDGSAVVKIYLTAWYYPAMEDAGQNLQYGPTQPANRTWNGQGAYPSSSPSYKPFPGSDPNADKSSVPDTASTKLADHRVPMKNVESVHTDDGAVALVSKHGNIKLDKLTTYVFAGRDLPSAK